MTTADLIIIGAGPGGYRAAEHAARHGLSVVIIEKEYAGGTCLNCGCIPTKTLARNAEVLLTLKESEVFGIQAGETSLDFQQVMARKQQVVEQLRSGVETLMKQPGITLVYGTAHFQDAHTVAVGEEQYTANNIIIATGSDAKMLPIQGIDQEHVITSTELLELKEIPQRLCIVGAGVIGMEFASVFSSFGTQVTVVEFLKECLPTIDSDIAKRLRQVISKRGVEFFMQSGVKAIEGHEVVFERKGKEQRVEADLILIATGRKPRLDDLQLENAGVEFSPRGINVDDRLQTNVEGVYAIGDVNARCMLAHAATMQGIHVVNEILGKSDDIDLSIMPAAIFTYPEAASVGLSEDQCKAQGIEYVCKKGFFRSNGKALAMNETDGMMKLLATPEGKIIGCHVFGAHAADMVQEVSALMCKHTTVSELQDMVHIHPTLGELVQEVSMQF
ncbi:MAG: dihydrolipoyl dehydrogenase [Prevotella sp.]|nr:dihydrolipoyl dehydrogenase [Prevotella sp.]